MSFEPAEKTDYQGHNRGDPMTMPNFFIVGAQKAGTTSLYYYLEQHPEVYMSVRKEPHFFEGTGLKFRGPGPRIVPVSDIEDYRALFAGVKEEKAIGEASASYLYSRRAPALIKQTVPDARIIAVLRNPADRAYSNYLHLVRVSREPQPDFARALEDEERRMEEGWGALWYYRDKGFYHDQVKRYFDTFGRDRVRVYLYDDLRADPLAVLGDIFRFLGVDRDFVPDLSVEHNTSGLPKYKVLYTFAKRLSARHTIRSSALIQRFLPAGPRRYVKSRIFVKPPPLQPEVRRELMASYRDDVLKLQDLLGRDLSRWLEGAKVSPGGT